MNAMQANIQGVFTSVRPRASAWPFLELSLSILIRTLGGTALDTIYADEEAFPAQRDQET